ncbi:uncharacterized protein TNCV_300911 [Trichonephila clavipes]|nr:uncharacterized protein TNCV_300911 [Trichonephila clavipes]
MLDHLEDNIRRVIVDKRPQMLEKFIENWTCRLDYIRASRGSPMPEIIFKILIWDPYYKIDLEKAHIRSGCGSPVVKVSDHDRHVMSSNPVPLKIRRVGQRCTLNLSRAETSSRWCGVVVRRGVLSQVHPTSLDHSSKSRGPSTKALM